MTADAVQQPTRDACPAGAETRTVFRSDELLVRAHLGRGSKTCFVVFDPMVDTLSLDRVAFAETFLASYGFDAVHVLSARNGWYQDPSLPAALERVRATVRGYDRVVTYGSSMGGYAALRFAPHVGAQAAIAISPQYSVLAEAAPFETRWLGLRKTMRWLHERPGDVLPATREVLVLFDDRNVDGQHARAIQRDLPGAVMVPVPYAGHPVAAMLVEVGLLSRTIVEAAEGRLDPALLRAELRRLRHGSGQYLFSLAKLQPFHRMRWKAALARRAVELVPDEPVYLSYAGLVLEVAGQRAEAASFHRRAVARSEIGFTELRYARFLWRGGQQAEARRMLQRAQDHLPPSGAPLELAAIMSAFAGEPETALALLAQRPSLRAAPLRHRLFQALSRRGYLRNGVARWVARQMARRQIRQTVLAPENLGRELSDADST